MKQPHSELVLVADVVKSAEVPNFRDARDQALAGATARHEKQGATRTPYTVTAWDEFQAVLSGIDVVPQVLLDLRTEFAPAHLYVGIGLGAIEGWEIADRPINQSLTGPGFVHARAALDALKNPEKGDELAKKGLRLTRFQGDGSDPEQIWLCRVLNLTYALHDSLVQQVSEKEWQVIRAMQQAGSGKKVAALLNKDESTISRQLKAGHYWQMRETVESLAALIRERSIA